MTAPVDLPRLTALLERATWKPGASIQEVCDGSAARGKLLDYDQYLPALIAELTAARERLAGEEGRVMREALLWADEHADDQDMNHVNFRVGAGSRARTALATLTKGPDDD